MTKFTYDEFKKKIRESLKPKPALVRTQGNIFMSLLNRARVKRQGPGL
jgi:hypothetical protein